MLLAALGPLTLTGCERIFRDMYDQPKLKTATGTPLFADGLASRPPPPGALPIALGEIAANTSGTRGRAPSPRSTTPTPDRPAR